MPFAFISRWPRCFLLCLVVNTLCFGRIAAVDPLMELMEDEAASDPARQIADQLDRLETQVNAIAAAGKLIKRLERKKAMSGQHGQDGQIAEQLAESQDDLARAVRKARLLIVQLSEAQPEAMSMDPGQWLILQGRWVAGGHTMDSESKQPNRSYEQALQLYERARTESASLDRQAEATYRAATMHEKLGRLDEAIGSFQQVAADFPMSSFALHSCARIGRHHLTIGERNLSHARDGIGMDAEQIEHAIDKGRAHFRQAAEWFQRTRRFTGDDSLQRKSFVLAGLCYKQATDYKLAVEVLEAALEFIAHRDPTLKAEAYYWLYDTRKLWAESLQEQGKGKAAVEAQRTAAKDAAQYLINTFPETRWARYARRALQTAQIVDGKAKTTGAAKVPGE